MTFSRAGLWLSRPVLQSRVAPIALAQSIRAATKYPAPLLLTPTEAIFEGGRQRAQASRRAAQSVQQT